MIRVAVGLDTHGVLRGLRASGHAGSGTRGNDIVCAAASVLLRTFARTVEDHPRVTLSGGAEKRGEMSLEISSYEDGDRLWLTGVTVFLLQGLRDLSTEHPDRCEVLIGFDDTAGNHRNGSPKA